jgi:hypothetical protein
MQKTLYTIGYEGVAVQAFARALTGAGMNVRRVDPQPSL